MRALNRNCLHWDAVGYYYDFVVQDASEVPDVIARHVRRCLFCRVQIHRLKEIIAETDHETDPQRDRMSRDIIDTLNLHFRCLGEPVTCEQVKPFLPGLFPPAPKIRIPTPITVHVDHCPECAEDLSVLRGLGLNGGQLQRLGRLYDRRPAADASLCRRARLKIPAFASAAPEGIESEVLGHLCTCPSCREQVYQHRQKLLEGAAPAGSCDTVSMADIFDYVVAADEAAEDDKGDAAHRPDGAHVRDCRRCMETMQALHRAVYHITERADSDVVTVYNTVEDVSEAPADGALYPKYPIDVQVIHRQAEPAVAKPAQRAAAVAAFSRTATLSRYQLWLKAAIVAAALIPLTFFFFYTPTVRGVTFAQVVRALARAENVHVVRYLRDATTPTYEVWASRSAGMLMRTTRRTRTVYDLNRKTSEHVDLATGTSESGQLSGEEYQSVLAFAEGSLGLASVDLPPDATWRNISGDETAGTSVYELAWTEKQRSGRSVLVRWEIEIDTETRLPQSARAFTKRSGDDEWWDESKLEFDYPTSEQLRAAIEPSDSLQ